MADGQKNGRGRPSAKVRGLADEPLEHEQLLAEILELERAVVAAVASPAAGTIEGQSQLAALEARLWTLRSLAVTDITTRIRCALQADIARTSMARLARAGRDSQIRKLVKQVDAQRDRAAGFGTKRAK